MINEDLSSPNGAIIIDETGFTKKDADSIGY
jgi:hypothetical protein